MTFDAVHIRGRLTLWNIGIFGLVLSAYVGGACIIQYTQLTDQLYHAEVQDMETVQGLLYFAPDGALSLHEEYFNRAQSRLLLERLMEVLDPNGQVLFRNRKLNGMPLGGPLRPAEGVDGFSPRSLRMADGTPVLAISHRHSIAGTPLLIRLAYSTEPLRFRVIQLFGVLMLLMPVALIAAGFTGYRLAGKALDPLEKMAQLTEHITERRLSERIPIQNPGDELGHMARVLNGLLERLENAFEKLQRFTADVSHELRTPLAAMRSVGEVGLQQDRNAADYRDIIGSMLEEVGKLTSMVDTLLTIAQAGPNAPELHPTAFSLLDLVQEAVAVASVLAEEKKQSILVAGDGRIPVRADRAFLRMVVVNLLDNAVKYSPSGTAIRLSLVSGDSQQGQPRFVELAVQDEGPGIPVRDAERVFDRFYRVDEARTRETGGAGLGLSIARWAVEANGGEIGLRPGPQGGAIFWIKLPIAEG